MADGRWLPILDGADAARARTAVRALAAAIERAHPGPSLGRGAAGIALLHGYLALDGETGARASAAAWLERAVEELAETEPGPWLFSGIAGVAWTLEHLGRAGVVNIDESTLEELDALVGDIVAPERWTFEWELMAGLVGLGVYALERGARPAAAAVVARVVAHLDALVEPRAPGLTWRSPGALLAPEEREQNPAGYFNLGLGHGVPGAIAFLAAAAREGGTAAAAATALLAGAVPWLLAQERPPGETGLRVPMRIGAALRPHDPIDSWCYGDPGVAVALVAAGQAADRADWIARGRDLALASARRAADRAGAALLDGAAGRAHIFHRIARATGDAELTAAARTAALGLIDAPPPPSPGLLEGAAGVALALLATVSAVEPSWDRVLLAALPQGGQSSHRTQST